MIRHLDCGAFQPVLLGFMVSHVLLVERPDGLVLVDTGFGRDDLADLDRMGRTYARLTRPRLALEHTARARVQALGHDPDAVTDIVLTHLDHAGGVPDFPWARVHLLDAELDAARDPHGKDHGRYLTGHWQQNSLVGHQPADRVWHGFESVAEVDPDLLLVPLPGHSRGHAGVAVRVEPGADRWLLHAGDAYFRRRQLLARRGGSLPLRVLERALADDDDLRRAQLDPLRHLATTDNAVDVVCAHDPTELPTPPVVE